MESQPVDRHLVLPSDGHRVHIIEEALKNINKLDKKYEFTA